MGDRRQSKYTHPAPPMSAFPPPWSSAPSPRAGVPMTDLEDFKAFFKSKGVKFTVDGPDDREGTWVCVHDAQFWFNDHGNYTGTYNYESGHFTERIPAPERE